jgi:hypothetical protein
MESVDVYGVCAVCAAGCAQVVSSAVVLISTEVVVLALDKEVGRVRKMG